MPARPASLLLPLPTLSYPAGERCRLSEFSMNSAVCKGLSSQTWAVHMLHIPKRGLALDRLLRETL